MFYKVSALLRAYAGKGLFHTDLVDFSAMKVYKGGDWWKRLQDNNGSVYWLLRDL